MHFVTKYASVYLSIAQKLQSFEYFLNVIITGIFFQLHLAHRKHVSDVNADIT